MSLSQASQRALRPLDLRQGEVQEILTTPPPRLAQVGLLSVTCCLALTMLLLWRIRYPEVVTGKLVAVSARPPISVVSNADGRIVRFFAQERGLVQADEPVLLLDNPARFNAVGRARAALDQLRQGLDQHEPPTLESIGGLGEIQNDYAAVVRLAEELRTFRSSQQYAARIAAIAASVRNQGALRRELRSQQLLLSRGTEVAAKALAREETLKNTSGLASAAEVDTALSTLLDAQARHKELDVSVARSRVDGADAEQLLAQLQQEKVEREAGLRRSVREALDRALAGIAQWEYRYLLRAPIAGRLAFHDVWAPEQPVRKGQDVFYVVPDEEEIIGRVTVPQRGFGRVRTGQRVRVKFDGYPFEHFGLVEGQLDSISLTAKQDGYVLSVRFPRGLETSMHRRLPFAQGMSAEAEIVTDDLSLLGRFLTPFRRLLVGGSS